MLFWLPYFSPESLGFFCIRLLECFIVIFQLLIEFSFIVLECPILSVLFYPLSISLQSSFFCQYFLVYFLKLNCKFFLCCLFFPVLIYSSDFLLFFSFSCFRMFFFYLSRNSHSGFDFSFVIFEGIPIFSQTNFVPA